MCARRRREMIYGAKVAATKSREESKWIRKSLLIREHHPMEQDLIFVRDK